jgi:hypothetical protein
MTAICRVNHLKQLLIKSVTDHGASVRKRLVPDKLALLSTCRSNPDSVFVSWQSINPSSMVTKYLNWGLLNRLRNVVKN